MTILTPDLTAISTKHRAIWASGDYPSVAADLIPDLGTTLVEAAGITAGQRVLDIGAGTGNAAIPAALTGADVVASDLTPQLLAVGAELAAACGARLQWVEADAQALPFETGEFDSVLSCVGIMFAPFHERAAGELLRVCRPGGTIGLLSWTPEGFVGRLFATMRPFAPAPPSGASPAPLWGQEDHVRSLFGDGVRRLRTERRTATFDVETTPAAFREWWKRSYGPTIAVYASLAGDAERIAQLDAAFLSMLEETQQPGHTWEAEYLIVVAERS